MSPLGPLSTSPSNYYLPTSPINIPHKPITTRFVNSTSPTNCIWFDARMPPHNLNNEFSVVLCYYRDDDDYCVCYWDGEHFLALTDDMPFETTQWTFLPYVPKER